MLVGTTNMRPPGKPSKILVIGSMGRTGTTLLQSILSRRHGLENLGECLPYDATRDAAIGMLAGRTGWIGKMFLEPETAVSRLREIRLLAPDVVYNSHREDLFDQYLSVRLSITNDKWNGATKLLHSPIAIGDASTSIAEFLEAMDAHDRFMAALRLEMPVVDMSYERMLDEMAGDIAPGDTVKQTTLAEKLALVTNIGEVRDAWHRLRV